MPSRSVDKALCPTTLLCHQFKYVITADLETLHILIGQEKSVHAFDWSEIIYLKKNPQTHNDLRQPISGRPGQAMAGGYTLPFHIC